MAVDISGRNFLKLLDFTPEEIQYLIDLSADLKAKKRAGEPHRYLEGKNIVLLFEKTSTRTRCSFEVGAMDLGMGVTYLDPKSSQMGKKESIEDTARVLGRMYDGIEYRICSVGPHAQKSMPSFAHTTMRELPTLLPASPMKVSFLPLRSRPNSSWTVSMSAIICVGWNSVVRPFHTGTPA